MKKTFCEKTEKQTFFYAYSEEGFGSVNVECKKDGSYIVSVDDVTFNLTKKDVKNFYYELTEDRKCIRITCENSENIELIRIKNHLDSCNIVEDSDVYCLK